MANMSTSNALIDTVEFVTDALEKCDNCSIVSIDLKKEFYTIEYMVLYINCAVP